MKQREIHTCRLDFPAGPALDGRGLLLVANNTYGGENPLRSPGSVAIYDPSGDGKEIGRCPLPDRYHRAPAFPLAICVLRDGSKAFVDSEAQWRGVRDRLVRPGTSTICGDNCNRRRAGRNDTQPRSAIFSWPTPRAKRSASSIRPVTRRIGTILVRPEQARGLPAPRRWRWHCRRIKRRSTRRWRT